MRDKEIRRERGKRRKERLGWACDKGRRRSPAAQDGRTPQNRAVCRGRASCAAFCRASPSYFDEGASKVRFSRVRKGEVLIGISLVGREKGKKGLSAIGKGSSLEAEGRDDYSVNDGDAALKATIDKSEKVRAMQKELARKALFCSGWVWREIAWNIMINVH